MTGKSYVRKFIILSSPDVFYPLSKFLRRSLGIFIIKGFRTIVFVYIAISTTFRPVCPPAFFRCSSNSKTFTELRTTSFIESTGVACSDSVSHNRLQVLSIPAWLLNTCTRLWLPESEQVTPVDSIKDVVRSSVKVFEFDKQLKKAGGHTGGNVVEITIKMKTIVRKPLMIKKSFLPALKTKVDLNTNHIIKSLFPHHSGIFIRTLHLQ